MVGAASAVSQPAVGDDRNGHQAGRQAGVLAAEVTTGRARNCLQHKHEETKSLSIQPTTDRPTDRSVFATKFAERVGKESSSVCIYTPLSMPWHLHLVGLLLHHRAAVAAAFDDFGSRRIRE